MHVNLCDSNISDGPNNYKVTRIMQHAGSHLQGQILTMDDTIGLGYGQRFQISIMYHNLSLPFLFLGPLVSLCYRVVKCRHLQSNLTQVASPILCFESLSDN